jgi:hypothetical protein
MTALRRPLRAFDLVAGAEELPVKSTGMDTIAVRNSSDTALALQVILAISADAVADGPIN